MLRRSDKFKTLLLVGLLSVGTVTGGVVEPKVANATPQNVVESKQAREIGIVKPRIGLNLRKGPSTKHGIITALKQNSKVDIIQKESSGWYKVNYEGKIGYVRGNYLKINNETNVKPENNTPVGQKVGIVTARSGLNFRKGPSTKDTIITTLIRNTKVNIIEKANNNWYKVSYNGRVGFMCGNYLRIVGGEVSKPEVKPENNTPIGQQVGTVTASGLNFRTGPSTKHSIITVLKRNTKVTIIEKANNNWYKVNYKGKIGYVCGDYLKIDGETSVKPEVKPTPQPEVKPEPEKPQVPEVKPEPEKPQVPEVKPEPEKPQVPEVKPEPEKPQVPEVKPEPEKPQVPEVKPEPEKPQVPEVKPEPEKPQVPDVKPEPEKPQVPDVKPQGISIEEFRAMYDELGVNEDGEFIGPTGYEGQIRTDFEKRAVHFALIHDTPAYREFIRKSFNLLLPTRGEELYNIVRNKVESQTIEMDGRRVEITVYKEGIAVSIFDK